MSLRLIPSPYMLKIRGSRFSASKAISRARIDFLRPGGSVRFRQNVVEVTRSVYRADRYTLWVPVCRPNTPVKGSR